MEKTDLTDLNIRGGFLGVITFGAISAHKIHVALQSWRGVYHAVSRDGETKILKANNSLKYGPVDSFKERQVLRNCETIITAGM
jgi:hypothetical protein